MAPVTRLDLLHRCRIALPHAAARVALPLALPLALVLGPLTLHGQPGSAVSTGPGSALLAECSALAGARQPEAAATVGKRAQAEFRGGLARNPRDVRTMVGLARTLSQCLVPAADLMQQGELSGEAIELLQNALEIEPRHWLARFVLASIYLRSPSFLGRGPLAANEFDVLLAQQGDRTNEPMHARVFELRGLMLSRAGLADSARALWSRGSTLFPADSALRALVERTPAAPSAARRAPPGRDTTVSVVQGTTPPAPERSSTPASLGTMHVTASGSARPSHGSTVQQVGRSAVLMTAGGTADVMQAVQALPGATRVHEGSDVYTRGGGASETALVVDGGRVPSLSRFEGLNGGMFGALDPFIVKAVRYSSGGFSAKYGNALSGVIEIETDGRPRERQARAGISMAQGSATVRVPVGRKVGAWASGRLSNTGVILATHGRRGEFDGAPHSEELIASIIANPSTTTELRATVLGEQDDARRIVSAAGWEGPFHVAASARTGVLSARWMPADAVVVRSSIAAMSRASAWAFGVLARDRDERSTVARSDIEWVPSATLTLRGGVEHGRHARGDEGTVPSSALVNPGAPVRALLEADARTTGLGGYAEAQLSRGNTSLLVGVRADRLPGEIRTTLDPRITLSTRRGAWTGRIGAGQFHQGRWQSAPAIPDAATPSGMPGEAHHLIAGVEHEGRTTFRAEAFEKRYGDYAALGAGPQIRSAVARGVDMIAQRSAGSSLSGWIGYSLLSANVRLTDGRSARSPYDVTHSATASATLAIDENWSVGTTGRYGTGAPITSVVGATQGADGRLAPLYGATSGDRLPAYGRLDVRVMRFVRLPSVLISTFAEAINVAGRPNVSSISYDASYRVRVPNHAFFASRTVVVGAELQWR